MEKKINIILTKKNIFMFEGLNSHLPLSKEERVKNIKFFNAEVAIDWLLNQPWDSSNERTSIEEWLVIGEKSILLSYTLVWEGRDIQDALDDLAESRQRCKKRIEKELFNSFLA